METTLMIKSGNKFIDVENIDKGQEFEIIANFNTWLKICTELKNHFSRVLYFDKHGRTIGYFKKN